ncbi:MAG: ClC family H(+)/Cl(-) exchange transporter [Eubacteriaceae bacterium]
MRKGNKNNIYNTLVHWQNFKLKLMFEGIIVGVLSGFLIVFYRIMLEKAEGIRNWIIKTQFINFHNKIIWFLVLIIGAYVVGLLLKNEPLISGSGIPQVEGVLLRRFKMNWVSVIIKKFIGGVLSIGAGLSLGREGPSIQLGASIGQGVSRVFKRYKIEEKYLITSGASAGLAAAFNAPLAGVMFSLEEVHRQFSPLILLSAMSASLTADFISKSFFGLKPILNFERVIPLPLNNYRYVIILGIIVGVFGVFYNKVLIKILNFYKKQTWLPMQFRPMVPFLFAGILALLLPQALGGGHSLINLIVNSSFTIRMLIIILVIKFIFSMISYGSGSPGGIFFPLLVLGALTGAIYGNVLVKIIDINPIYIENFMILAMAGYFTAIVRAPITGSILITEMTGSFSHLLALSVISLVAYTVADLLKSEPIYESLLNGVLEKNSEDEFPVKSKDKSILEVPVGIDSTMDGEMIKNLPIPLNCLLVGISRGNKELIPNGDTIVKSGDNLVVLVNEDEAAILKNDLLTMGGKSKLTDN